MGFNGLNYTYFMFIFYETLVSVASLLLNTLIANKFILHHELSRNWKKKLRNILRNNKQQWWCITNVGLLKKRCNTQTIQVLV